MRVHVSPAVRSAAAMALAAALMAGCANTHSVVVGAVPDDYRTNHPIIVGEQMRTIDIPVGYSDRGANRVQIGTLDGFMAANYDQSAKPVVRVLVPSGSANAYAASAVAGDLVHRLRQGGVPEGYILHQPYQAEPHEDQAPIRIAFTAMTASTGPCGRWDEDLLNNTANKHYTNFGCASQSNLAAQVANPADFLTPRRIGAIDAQNRARAIGEYQTGTGQWDSEIDY
ncbi:pilus assembly protein CpaD [Chelativorans sp. ZYF759]|uniref:CpaD family pilus assembly protein n=1 Tax=Chelativorans sp. ZYF759 TaxID=2692213 RepID=UPI00145C6098|nr:CpaD family pilus assembly lipoprotein [Chelativorans sp. ZYF759]NMG40517.1 pilus assembly protein CpaD [Chelativorans sp. ZYF759]